MMTLCELCEKFVVSLSTGANLGRVDDLVFSPESAQITHLVIFGKPRWFGIFGRGEDVRIAWSDVRTIGADAVLIEGNEQKSLPDGGRKVWKFGGA